MPPPVRTSGMRWATGRSLGDGEKTPLTPGRQGRGVASDSNNVEHVAGEPSDEASLGARVGMRRWIGGKAGGYSSTRNTSIAIDCRPAPLITHNIGPSRMVEVPQEAVEMAKVDLHLRPAAASASGAPPPFPPPTFPVGCAALSPEPGGAPHGVPAGRSRQVAANLHAASQRPPPSQVAAVSRVPDLTLRRLQSTHI